MKARQGQPCSNPGTVNRPVSEPAGPWWLGPVGDVWYYSNLLWNMLAAQIQATTAQRVPDMSLTYGKP
jgi:hypothetical protein